MGYWQYHLPVLLRPSFGKQMSFCRALWPIIFCMQRVASQIRLEQPLSPNPVRSTLGGQLVCTTRPRPLDI
jgi:hypothetical protein